MPARPTRVLIGLGAVVALALAGCSNGDGDGESESVRPSVQELADYFSLADVDPDAGILTEEQATCFGQTMYDSELSDEALRAVLDEESEYVRTAEEDELFRQTSLSAMMNCGMF